MGSEEHPHDEIQMDFVCAEVVLSADYDTEEEDMINADSDSSGSDETQMDSVSAVAPQKPTRCSTFFSKMHIQQKNNFLRGLQHKMHMQNNKFIRSSMFFA